MDAMGERSFGGYVYQQRLSVGVFGEVFRALSGAGKEARVVHVDPRLAAEAPFLRALVQYGRDMPVLDHPRVVGLRQVGRRGEQVVVLTDAVTGPVVLEDLLGRGSAPAPLPDDVAMALGCGVVEGLAHAHSLAALHGAVHPRSVLIDFHGGVKLADFGLGWAVTEASRGGARVAGLADIVRGLGDTIAPEVRRGGAITPASDVFSAGMLLERLLTSSRSASGAALTPAIGRIIARARSVEPAARPVNGTELEELLEEAIVADGRRVAPPDEVARFVTERLAAVDEHLDAATEDLVALLANEPDPPPLGKPPAAGPTGGSRPGQPRRRGLTDALADLDDDTGTGAGTGTGTGTGIVTGAGTDTGATHLEADLTEVDDDGRMLGVSPDPISEILKMEDLGEPRRGPGAAHPPAASSLLGGREDETPLPPPAPDRPGSVTRSLEALKAEDEAIRRRARSVPAAAIDPLALDPDLGALTRRKKGHPLLWLAVTVFFLAGLGALLYTQTDLFDPGRRADAARQEKEARDEALARHRAAQPVPVDLTINASEPDAAVWLLLGRTPLDSLPLSSAMVHELRVEHEGYQAVDLRVTGYEWKGDEKTRHAQVSATLTAGHSTLPPFPPAPASPPPPGPPGRGVLHVTSTPSGAEVWLLIGFGPRATITGLEAGRAYEVKVLKDGFLPGLAAVKADDWYLSGRSGPVKDSIERDVHMDPIHADHKGKSRRHHR